MAGAQRPRLPAMDALRAGAALMVVSTHAAIAYMDVRMPGILWVIHDRSSSPLLDWVFLWCNGVSMPLFFLLAGFFAAQVYDERGPVAFLQQRLRRLLVPFVAGCIVILPVTFYVWAGGWLLTGRCTLKQILRVHFDPSIQASLYGPAHLWFLEYLLLLCLLFAGVASLYARTRRRWVGPSTPLVFIVATALILWVEPAAPVHFHHSFMPAPGRLLYYAVFFVAGVWLFGRTSCLRRSAWMSMVYVLVSVVAFCGVAWLLPRHLGGEVDGLSRLFLVTAMLLFAWFSVLGLVSLAHRFLDRECAGIAYLAAASYWIYLVHFPVVGVAQVGMSQLPLPALVKYAAVFAVAVFVSLLSYAHVVRSTFIGRWLNGTRRLADAADRLPRASTRAVAETG